MPRRSRGPRLYLDPQRKQWTIRDGRSFVRTGCAENQRAAAEERLAEYISAKYSPPPSPSPLIADILLAYKNEHVQGLASEKNILHTLSNLEPFWGDKRLVDVNKINCRSYAAQRPQFAARRDLETLRASINYWHEEKMALLTVPNVWMPDRAGRRERWLTQEEAKKLRKAAMAVPHLYRFVVIGLLTGSRSGAILKLEWNWVNLERGVMLRMAPGAVAAVNKQKPPVRINPALLRLMRLWKRKDGRQKYVVHYMNDRVRKLRRSFETAVREAGLFGTGVSAHTLRHTRATWLMQSGTVTPWEAAGSLGMSVKVLEGIYAHHHPDFQEAASRVGSRAVSVPRA
jgi:integrase